MNSLLPQTNNFFSVPDDQFYGLMLFKGAEDDKFMEWILSLEHIDGRAVITEGRDTVSFALQDAYERFYGVMIIDDVKLHGDTDNMSFSSIWQVAQGVLINSWMSFAGAKKL